MIKISNISFTLEQIIGEAKLQLLHSKPTRQYENGKATDLVIGTTYEVVQHGGDFEKFTVKVPDVDTAISEEDIAASKDPIFVEFTNTSCKLYKDVSGRIQVSVKADAINVL